METRTVRRFFARRARALLERFGHTVVPRAAVEPIDLRDETDCPLTAQYLARRSSFLIEVPVEHCRNLWWFSCALGSGNPFVDTVEAYLRGECMHYEGSPLERYYREYQPRTAADVFSFAGDLSPELAQHPAHAFVWPWEYASFSGRAEFRRRFAREENRQRGGELGLKHGLIWCGPASPAKGQTEFATLTGVSDDIRRRGYLRHGGVDGDISAFVLVRDDDYRLMVREGNHRAAALAALGAERIPVRIYPGTVPPILRREEVSHWPKVRDGVFTPEQALAVFDRVFDGWPAAAGQPALAQLGRTANGGA